MFSQIDEAGIQEQGNPAGRSIEEQVRRNLTDALDDEGSVKELFLLGDQAVPSLIKFLSDPDKEIRAGAARGLGYIGNPQGMQALRVASRTEKNKEAKGVISCFLAGALVDSRSESDVLFLKETIEGARFTDDDDQDFPAFCAALALGMMGRSDSLPILRKAAGADDLDSEEIGKAILWMEKSSSGQGVTEPASNDEAALKELVLNRTLFAEKERDKTSVEQVTFNRARNRALVSLEIYLNPKSARGYDLVLAKESGSWRVVGIWFAWVA